MSIITVPHPTLRLTAQEVTTVDKKLQQLLKELDETLRTQKNPQGVGLAAPQVNSAKRIFATFLADDENDDDAPGVMRLYINPKIVDHDEALTFGPDPENPILEGCLSIPELYGPVPRWQRLKLEWQTLEGDELVTQSRDFSDFTARVIQHEFDHLQGVLFTDYSLKYDLPIYRSSTKSRSGTMTEIDKRLVEGF